MRHRAAAVILLLVVAAGAVGGLVWLATRTHHGTGNLNVKAPTSSSTSGGAALKQVRLCQGCAFGFNPLSTPQQRAPPTPSLAIDNQLGTAWTTQTYYSGTLNKAGTRPVRRRQADDQPPGCSGSSPTTPGFTAHDLRAQGPATADLARQRLGEISATTVVSHKQDIQLTGSGHEVPVLPRVDHEPRGASELGAG